MSFNEKDNEENVLARYRPPASWGGALLGGIVGAVIGGPNLNTWANPLLGYAAYILGGVVTGAILAFGACTFFMGGIGIGTYDE